jgi:hypothetical protein
MSRDEEHQLNETAFRSLRESIAKEFPHGQLVAISGGQVVASAARLEDLRSLLLGLGKDPARTLVVRAGVEYPETATLFLETGNR